MNKSQPCPIVVVGERKPPTYGVLLGRSWFVFSVGVGSMVYYPVTSHERARPPVDTTRPTRN